jgi:hypothetical protein
VCVASAFPIATGKHIGDCDPVPSISASCTPALEAGDARSTASITNCVMAGTDGRTKVAKVGPLRARVKSAKVRPTPYVYYPPVNSTMPAPPPPLTSRHKGTVCGDDDTPL